jgi:Raf kinase inhibitor-like YbhB/YbcL family protein
MTFRVTSEAFHDGGRLPDAQVFDGMGYTGANLSPALVWEDPPQGTKSFVLTCYDPDAPTGSGWWHWVVANLPADCRALPEGAGSGKGGLPEGAIQTRTDFGAPGYGGAAPPPGPAHRYIFTVHALKVDRIDVDESASGAMVGFNVYGNTLGSASTTALYGAD